MERLLSLFTDKYSSIFRENANILENKDISCCEYTPRHTRYTKHGNGDVIVDNRLKKIHVRNYGSCFVLPSSNISEKQEERDKEKASLRLKYKWYAMSRV